MPDQAKNEIKALTFEEVVALLKGADVVMLVPDGDSADTIANFVGFDEEGDESSDFSVGADGWDDVTLTRGCGAEKLSFNGILGLRFPGAVCTVVPLYGKSC